MTLKEADEAAKKGLPIIHDDGVHGRMEYKRIVQTGYHYTEEGARIPFVQLLDKCRNSVTSADPAFCSVKES